MAGTVAPARDYRLLSPNPDRLAPVGEQEQTFYPNAPRRVLARGGSACIAGQTIY